MYIYILKEMYSLRLNVLLNHVRRYSLIRYARCVIRIHTMFSSGIKSHAQQHVTFTRTSQYLLHLSLSLSVFYAQ